MGRIRTGLFTLTAALFMAIAAGEVWAQDLFVVQVQGRVLDDATGEPIAGADVLMLNSFGDRMARRTSDEQGRFSFEVRRASGVQFQATRIGYEPVSSPVLYFDDRYFFAVELRMDVNAVLLAPLEVVVRSEAVRSPVLSGFDHRVGRGMGRYITREDMEQIRPRLVTDVLGNLPGVRLEGSGRGFARTVVMSRSESTLMPGGGGVCSAQIFLDGRLMNRGGIPAISPDDLVSPADVEGIEVYSGISTVPAEFLTPEARCGVIAIWTRRGDQDR